MGEAHEPLRIRFRAPLTVIPPVVGIGVAIPLWGDSARTEFFFAATEVLAIGAIGMALTGRFFRIGIHREAGLVGAYAIFNILWVLISTGVGLFCSFRALATGQPQPEDLALVSAALATGVAAFVVQAVFGTPGMRDDKPSGDVI